MYFLEIFGAAVLFFLVAMSFYPMMGGCLILLIFFGIIVSLVIFLSLNLIWVILVGGLLYLWSLLFRYFKYKKLPTLENYVALHPTCQLNSEIACYNCNSTKLGHIGLYRQMSKLRYYRCHQCGKQLYKFKVL